MGWTIMSWKTPRPSNPANMTHLCAIDLTLADINNNKSMALVGATSTGQLCHDIFQGIIESALNFRRKVLVLLENTSWIPSWGRQAPYFCFLYKSILCGY